MTGAPGIGLGMGCLAASVDLYRQYQEVSS